MYPLFVPGRDYAVITHIEPDKLKKGMLFYTEDMIIQEFLYYTEYAE